MIGIIACFSLIVYFWVDKPPFGVSKGTYFIIGTLIFVNMIFLMPISLAILSKTEKTTADSKSN
jgi:hypothetical protein